MKQGNGRYILRLTIVLLLITVITAALLGLGFMAAVNLHRQKRK